MRRVSIFGRAFLALRIVIIVIVAAALFMYAVSDIERGQREEMRRNLEETLRKSSAACYSIEGRYPPSVEYLEEHYGVQIDYDRYAVFYDIFAENLMPDITVVEK